MKLEIDHMGRPHCPECASVVGRVIEYTERQLVEVTRYKDVWEYEYDCDFEGTTEPLYFKCTNPNCHFQASSVTPITEKPVEYRSYNVDTGEYICTGCDSAQQAERFTELLMADGVVERCSYAVEEVLW